MKVVVGYDKIEIDVDEFNILSVRWVDVRVFVVRNIWVFEKVWCCFMDGCWL